MLRIIRYLILFFPFASFAQLSPEVDSIYESLSADNFLAENPVNASSLIVFDNKFRSLASIATDAELLHVAINGTSALKECAMGDLVERKSPYLNELFIEYLQSAEMYNTVQAGRVIETTPAIQLFKRISWQREKRQRKEYYERTANSKELVELKVLFGRDFSTKWSVTESDSVLKSMVDGALLYDDISNENLSAILKINEYRCGNYERIKHFAQKYRSPDVITALGVFKNNSDVPFLTLNFDNAFAAISRFPHPSFFGKLKMKSALLYDEPLYQDAIASYKTVESKAVLEDIFVKIKENNPVGDLRDEKLLSFYNIIEKKNCKLYESVLDKISR